MKSKFDTIFEQHYKRLVQTGAIAGDYVKFKSNFKSSDWYKNLDEARKSYVDSIATKFEQGKPLYLSYVKTNHPENSNLDSIPLEVANIAVEETPGLYVDALDIPYELLDYHMDQHTARSTYKDPSNRSENPTQMKPEKPEIKEPDLGAPTRHDNGNYDLPSNNTSIPAQTPKKVNYAAMASIGDSYINDQEAIFEAYQNRLKKPGKTD